MKIRLRAERLLGLDEHQHVPLEGLAAEMNISPYQLKHILNGSSKQISRHTLEAVCQYLLDHDRVKREALFQQLFEIVPESFWPLLAARQRINFSMGVRKGREAGAEQFVVAADAVLQNVMVNRLMGAQECDKAVERDAKRQVIDSQLVLTWRTPGVSDALVQEQATAFYNRWVRGQKNSATVCIGSIKSNPTCDNVIAHAWANACAFQPEDNVRHEDDRSCPFVMIYRDEDPHPVSCWGGLRLVKNDPRAEPGIYYAGKSGMWEYAPCTDLEDAALVHYHFRKSRQNLEMVWGGFTGRSTRLLAEMLSKGQAAKFWPPAIDNRHVSVGVFIVRFSFRQRPNEDTAHVALRDLRTKPQVIALTEKVMAPRLAK